MKQLTLLAIFKILQILSVVGIILTIWFAIIFIRSGLSLDTFLWSILLSVILDGIVILLCWLKWKIVFVYAFLLNIYPFVGSNHLPWSFQGFLKIGVQPEFTVVLYLVSIIVSLLGMLVVVRNFLNRCNTKLVKY